MSGTENNFLWGRIGQFVPKSKRLLIGKIFWDSLHLGFIAKTNYSNTKVGAEHAFLQHANSKFWEKDMPQYLGSSRRNTSRKSDPST